MLLGKAGAAPENTDVTQLIRTRVADETAEEYPQPPLERPYESH